MSDDEDGNQDLWDHLHTRHEALRDALKKAHPSTEMRVCDIRKVNSSIQSDWSLSYYGELISFKVRLHYPSDLYIDFHLYPVDTIGIILTNEKEKDLDTWVSDVVTKFERTLEALLYIKGEDDYE